MLTTKKGFTLIEMLMVLAIIGILSGIVIMSVGPARMKGRDTQRISDLNSIRTALEIYKAQKGYYPTPGTSNCGAANVWYRTGGCPNCTCWARSDTSVTTGIHSSWVSDTNSLQNKLQEVLPDYTLPIDPINILTRDGPWYEPYPNQTNNYGYIYGARPGQPQIYDLIARFEDPKHPYRCGVKKWLWHNSNNISWCKTELSSGDPGYWNGGFDYSKRIYADH